MITTAAKTAEDRQLLIKLDADPSSDERERQACYARLLIDEMRAVGKEQLGFDDDKIEQTLIYFFEHPMATVLSSRPGSFFGQLAERTEGENKELFVDVFNEELVRKGLCTTLKSEGQWFGVIRSPV